MKLFPNTSFGDLAAAALRTLDDPAVRAADCFSDALFVEIASIVPPIVASMTKAAADGDDGIGTEDGSAGSGIFGAGPRGTFNS